MRTMASIVELRRDTLARHLREHLAGAIRFDAASRRLYSTDASIYQVEPLGVVVPRTTDDVVATVQVCAEMSVPIIARGGTSLSGQPIGPGVAGAGLPHLRRVSAGRYAARHGWLPSCKRTTR